MRGGFLKTRFKDYTIAIQDAGAPLYRCNGSIYCTKIRMCRYSGHKSYQWAVCSGHKIIHCLIFKTLTTPDHLMFSLYGHIEGRRHDMNLLRQIELNQVLSDCLMIDGEWVFYIWWLSILLRTWLQKPFTRGLCFFAEGAFKTRMSEVKVSVEHNYNDLKQLWSSQDFVKRSRSWSHPYRFCTICQCY